MTGVRQTAFSKNRQDDSFNIFDEDDTINLSANYGNDNNANNGNQQAYFDRNNYNLPGSSKNEMNSNHSSNRKTHNGALNNNNNFDNRESVDSNIRTVQGDPRSFQTNEMANMRSTYNSNMNPYIIANNDNSGYNNGRATSNNNKNLENGYNNNVRSTVNRPSNTNGDQENIAQLYALKKMNAENQNKIQALSQELEKERMKSMANSSVGNARGTYAGVNSNQVGRDLTVNYENTIERLKTELQDKNAIVKRNREMEAQYRIMEEELVRTEKERALLEKKLEVAGQQGIALAAMKTQYKIINGENIGYQQEIKRLQSHNSAMSNKIADLENKNNDILTYEQKIRDIQQDLRDERQRVMFLEEDRKTIIAAEQSTNNGQQNEIKSYKSLLQSLKSENTRLLSELKDLKVTEGDVSKLRGQINDLENENQGLKSLLSQGGGRTNKREDDLSKNNALKNQLVISEAQTKLCQVEIFRITEEKRQLQKKIAFQEQDIDSLKEKLSKYHEIKKYGGYTGIVPRKPTGYYQNSDKYYSSKRAGGNSPQKQMIFPDESVEDGGKNMAYDAQVRNLKSARPNQNSNTNLNNHNEYQNVAKSQAHQGHAFNNSFGSFGDRSGVLQSKIESENQFHPRKLQSVNSGNPNPPIQPFNSDTKKRPPPAET